MWSFCFGLLFIHDPSSIKAALFLYYTSVLISTKIPTVLSLQDFYWHLTKRSYEIEGPRLPAGATHKLKPSPSTWPEPWSVASPQKCQLHPGFCIRFLCGSVLNSQPSRKDHAPSSVSICLLPLLITRPCFNTPDPCHPYLFDPRSCNLSDSDYYSSVISLV